MKRILSLLLIALISWQLSSAGVIVDYSSELNSQYTWKIDYVKSEGTGNSFDEIIVNGTISSTTTQVSDQGIIADLTSFQYTDEDTENIYGLVKLLEINMSNQLISVDENITDIFFNEFDIYIPLIWPINDAYWDMVIPNFNRSYTPNYAGHNESSRIILSNGKYIIDQFNDDTPVDGARNNASIIINSGTGLMEMMTMTSSAFYTINPPVHTQLKIALVDNDYAFPENTENNLLNQLGFGFTLILMSIIGISYRSLRNKNRN